MEDGREIKVLVSPLHQFVRDGWTDWEQGIESMQVEESEFLLYLVWALDAVKERSEGINRSLWKKLYDNIRQRAIKRHFNSPRTDLEYVTALTCACFLYCYGLILAESNVYREIHSEIISGLGEHWPAVRGIKRTVELTPLPKGLKAWMIDYMNWDGYSTVGEEMDWEEESMPSLPDLINVERGVTNVQVTIDKFVNQSGATYNDNSRITINHNGNGSNH
jgi:hypothetical protein